jgi:outer membrane protein OmpA-like peptidoglycan-associated protein
MMKCEILHLFLINAGISANRIDIQALGETAPAVQGNDEDARARNRRAVIVEQK